MTTTTAPTVTAARLDLLRAIRDGQVYRTRFGSDAREVSGRVFAGAANANPLIRAGWTTSPTLGAYYTLTPAGEAALADAESRLCPYCGQPRTLTRNGLVRKHGDPDKLVRPARDCPGTNHAPQPTEEIQ